MQRFSVSKLLPLIQKRTLKNNNEELNVTDTTEFCQKVTGTNTIKAQTFAIMSFGTFIIKGCQPAQQLPHVCQYDMYVCLHVMTEEPMKNLHENLYSGVSLKFVVIPYSC